MSHPKQMLLQYSAAPDLLSQVELVVTGAVTEVHIVHAVAVGVEDFDVERAAVYRSR